MKHIIFDLDGVLYDPHETRKPYPEAEEIVKQLLDNGHYLSLLSVGDTLTQCLKLSECRLIGAFSNCVIVGDDGSKRDALRSIIAVGMDLGIPLEDCVVVGDRLDLEIKYGKELGCVTIRVQRGKYAHTVPRGDDERPQYTVRSLVELPPLLEAM